MGEHTPTPWDIIAGDDYYITAEGYPKEFIGHFKSDDNGGYLAIVGNRPKDFGEANAAFIVKAVNSHDPLLKALQLQEAAEEAHANCGECNGEDVPELCPVCFPLFDDARIARRCILSAVGGSRDA